VSGREPVVWWLARALVAAASLAVLYVGIRYGTFAASDHDPYGYVSQADAMARGTLQIDQRFARVLSWPDVALTFCPPGWRPAATDGFIAPIYPAGLPVVMAAAQSLFGRTAVFYAVPILGALAVWATGLIGARIHTPLAGVAAAFLLASSPAFLYQVVQPVSDVAAACWWTVSLALAVRRTFAASVGAGVAAAMAILTRPNLVVLAAAPAAFLGWPDAFSSSQDRSDAVRRTLGFAAGVLPGCLAVLFLNQHHHGSPFASGYWQQSELFSWAHAAPNLDRYPRWLLQTQTPFIFLGLIGPLVARARETVPRAALLLWTFAALVVVSYLFYAPFGRDQWSYLRFLLPAYPPLLILSVMVCAAGLARVRLPAAVRSMMLVLICIGLTAWQTREAIRLGALRVQAAERRYVDVGTHIAGALPPNAIFFAGEQSGSIRYYSERPTVRYDLLEPHRLDFAVAELSAHGYRPYIALEEGEEPTFRERFGPYSELARLDWPPAVQRSASIRVRIYDPADRARFMAGEAIGTADVDLTKKPILTRKN
jgi:hypothetical protein